MTPLLLSNCCVTFLPPLNNNTYGADFFFPFSTAGVHDVNVNLGLGTGNAGRRDSFDRNTSAFSPSMDYARHKWPQYGTMGTYCCGNVCIFSHINFLPVYPPSRSVCEEQTYYLGYSVAKSFGSCVRISNSPTGYGICVQFAVGPHGLGQQRQQRADEPSTRCGSHV